MKSLDPDLPFSFPAPFRMLRGGGKRQACEGGSPPFNVYKLMGAHVSMNNVHRCRSCPPGRLHARYYICRGNL